VCVCFTGPWAPLKFLLEGQIAPYGVLGMTVFGCMFASLTEWPGQVSQVGSGLFLQPVSL